MKKTLYVICMAFAGCWLASSCTIEEDDLFEESASARMENRVKQYRDLLLEPENGWIMEYYPGGTHTIYGGYSLTVKFTKDGKCEFHSVLSEDLSETSTGLYSVRKDIGPTLDFDTYNDLFHYFSSPDIMDGEGHGTGLNGDYEFILGKVDGKNFEMRGKKHGALIRMYPLDGDPVAYLTKVKEYRDSYITVPGIQGIGGTFNGKPLTGDIISDQYFELRQGEDKIRFAFMFTDKGMKLYEPITLNGKTVSDLQWNEEDHTMTSSDGVAQIKLDINPKALSQNQLEGKYLFQCGEGNYDVEIITSSSSSFVMKGLPFDLNLVYNFKKGAIELKAQRLLSSPEVWVALWGSTTPGGPLSWNQSYGMISDWNGDKEHIVLTFEDNSPDWYYKGKKVKADALIIWQPDKGRYDGFGPTQFTNLVLTKK